MPMMMRPWLQRHLTTTLLLLHPVCLSPSLPFLLPAFFVSISPFCYFSPGLLRVDNAARVPSLQNQNSWTPLPMASLAAVDAPGPSSSDVLCFHPSIADASTARAPWNPAVPPVHAVP